MSISGCDAAAILIQVQDRERSDHMTLPVMIVELLGGGARCSSLQFSDAHGRLHQMSEEAE